MPLDSTVAKYDKPAVILVEDVAGYRRLLEMVIKPKGYKPLLFETATKCLEHLTGLSGKDLENLLEKDSKSLSQEELEGLFKNQSFLGYLVDMKTNPTPEHPENKIPEKLYNLLEQAGMINNNFYFMTGHQSPHDEGVLERTGAPCLIKDSYKTALKFLEEVEKVNENPVLAETNKIVLTASNLQHQYT